MFFVANSLAMEFIMFLVSSGDHSFILPLSFWRYFWNASGFFLFLMIPSFSLFSNASKVSLTLLESTIFYSTWMD
jgi:hypothetical protein